MKDGRPLVFAGLWDRWRAPDGTVIESFTINTIHANDLMKPLHDRMACILEPDDYLRWLDPGDPAKPPIELLRPYPAEKMRSWRVDKAVGNVRNDDALIREVSVDPNENHATRSLWDLN
jgi:putative SOS response-associated peptidase YedK